MTRVLISFTEPEAAKRAVSRPPGEGDGSRCEVELLAVARPAPLLVTESVPHRPNSVVGDCTKELEHSLYRCDVDRVLLPQIANRSLERARPVTVVV